MGRPPTPVGHYGKITSKEVPYIKRDGKPAKRCEARCYFRMADGSRKEVMRTGRTKTEAENRLKDQLTTLANEITGGDITGDTRFAQICDLWLTDFRQEQTMAGKSPTTAETYERFLRLWIKPALGELQAREVRAGACDRLVKKAHEKRSYETAASVRTVLSSVCGYAVRMGAMDSNPAKSVGRLSRGAPREIKAMTLDQRLELLEKLEKYGNTKQTDAQGRSLGKRGVVWLHLPDIVRSMLATGVRLGELLALAGEEIDPTAATVFVGHHLVREKGVGLRRLEYRKGHGRQLLLGVPQWSVPMWRRRKLASGGGPVFPSFNDEWLDPSNMFTKIREAMNECGFEWVTSHVWRKTVAHVLDEAGLSTNQIADQLGNTAKVVDQRYRKPRVANEAMAAALESMLGGAESG
jgi:integrase